MSDSPLRSQATAPRTLTKKERDALMTPLPCPFCNAIPTIRKVFEVDVAFGVPERVGIEHPDNWSCVLSGQGFNLAAWNRRESPGAATDAISTEDSLRSVIAFMQKNANGASPLWVKVSIGLLASLLESSGGCPSSLTTEERTHLLEKAMHSVAIDDPSLLRFTLANAVLRYEAALKELESRRESPSSPTDTERGIVHRAFNAGWEGAKAAQVHNHGPSEGKGLACRERRIAGRLVGECIAPPQDVRDAIEALPKQYGRREANAAGMADFVELQSVLDLLDRARSASPEPPTQRACPIGDEPAGQYQRGWCNCGHHRGEHGPMAGDPEHLLDEWGACLKKSCPCFVYEFAASTPPSELSSSQRSQQ